MKVALLPMGDVSHDTMKRLSDDLSNHGLMVTARDSLGIPAGAFDPGRHQLRADVLLRAATAREAGPFLAVVAEDMFAEGLNFVFGLANVDAHGAVISVARLRDSDPDRYTSRVLKEALHELGHTWGLPHCPTAGCVMQYSNSLEDADAKGDTFCDRCRTHAMPVSRRGRQ